MFDFGSIKVNIEVYGISEFFDIGVYYGVIDIFVDVVVGRRDKFIFCFMVKWYYKILKDVGCKVLYDEFEYVYLDFIFLYKEEL